MKGHSRIARTSYSERMSPECRAGVTDYARLVFEKQHTEITALFSAAGAVLAFLSALLSLLWFNRIL